MDDYKTVSERAPIVMNDEGIDLRFTNVSWTVNVWDPLATKTLRPSKFTYINANNQMNE